MAVLGHHAGMGFVATKNNTVFRFRYFADTVIGNAMQWYCHTSFYYSDSSMNVDSQSAGSCMNALGRTYTYCAIGQ